jgi:tripartite-type tricarboxylate transporter receptor subunit TctC
VPAELPRDILMRINSELVKALQHPDIKSGFAKVGAESVGNTPQEAAIFVRNEFKKWADVIKTAHIKAE